MMDRMDQSIDVSGTTVAVRIIKHWAPVAMMLAVMYYFSTDTFSNDNTRNIIEKIFLWFVPHASEKALATLNYAARKSAHFTEYAILAALLFRAFKADESARWRFRWALYSLLGSGSWALLDELHQSFTPTRSGSILDSLLDSSGALFMLVGIAIVTRRPGSTRERGRNRGQLSDLKSPGDRPV